MLFCVCVCAYHILLMDLLAFVNNAAVERECTYIFRTLLSILLDTYAEAELLDHLIGLFLTLWVTAILFSVVAALFYMSTNRAQGFRFPHTLDQHLFLALFLVVTIIMGVTISLWF